MSAFEVVFWVAVALLVYTHAGYPLCLWAFAAARRGGGGDERSEAARSGAADLPPVSLIIAAHDEEVVIGRKVRDALALEYPRDRLEVVVASDGSSDRTVELARAAGADAVLDLPRGGKVAALNAAVERSRGEVLAFSDANSSWRPEALRLLVERLAEPGVGYVCGRLRLRAAAGDNQEGAYWRYETMIRELESRLAGVTAGNGAINAVRREAYIFLEPGRGQDITLPFRLVKRGWKPVYEPRAVAEEPMAASIADEVGRKRRMLAGAWATMIGGGMLSPRGYSPLYAFQIVSHRLLRYATPFLHAVALAANAAIVGASGLYVVTLAAQLALVGAAAVAPIVPLAPFRVARYYVAVTAASALGLWDYARRRVPVTWDQAPGTREA